MGESSSWGVWVVRVEADNVYTYSALLQFGIDRGEVSLSILADRVGAIAEQDDAAVSVCGQGPRRRLDRGIEARVPTRIEAVDHPLYSCPVRRRLEINASRIRERHDADQNVCRRLLEVGTGS